MKPIFLSVLFLLGLAALGVGLQASHPVQQHMTDADEYVCLPCGHDCDKEAYTVPGRCVHCQMELVKKTSVTFKTIAPEEICKYIQAHPDVVLLDVRTKEEFEGKADPDYGRLKNAINIPVQELKDRLSEISSLKSKEVIVYCSHSHRSPQASYLLSQNGFTHVMNLSGGMSVMPDGPCKVSPKQ